MTITLNDGSLVSITLQDDGRRKVRFNGINKAFILPVGTVLTVAGIERLYQGYRAL